MQKSFYIFFKKMMIRGVFLIKVKIPIILLLSKIENWLKILLKFFMIKIFLVMIENEYFFYLSKLNHNIELFYWKILKVLTFSIFSKLLNSGLFNATFFFSDSKTLKLIYTQEYYCFFFKILSNYFYFLTWNKINL